MGRTILVAFRPLGSLHLYGAGLRAAFSRGPGAIPREEPLLPRLETLLGILAAAVYTSSASGGGGLDCSSAAKKGWEEVVLRRVLEALGLAGNGEETYIVGPLLHVTYRSGGEDHSAVYINASSGLLATSMCGQSEDCCIGKWVELAKELKKAKAKAVPREIVEEEAKAKKEWSSVKDKCFVNAEKIATRRVGVSLSPASKTAEHGLIYSLPEIDYAAAARADASAVSTRIVIAFIASRGGGGAPSLPAMVPRVGPRGPPARLEIQEVPDPPTSTAQKEYAIAVTNTPLALVEQQGATPLPHPSPPAPPLEQHTRSYATALCGVPLKDPPAPSLWPGTVIKLPPDRAHSLGVERCYTIGGARACLVYAPTKKLLERLSKLAGR